MLESFAASALNFILGMIAYVASWFVGLTGAFFNVVVYHTVLDMGGLVARMGGAVDIAWTLVRDISNLFILFGIVYLGAQLILGLHKGEYLRSFAYLLVAALLVNFSAYFTKFVIEISNLLSTQLYLATVEDASSCLQTLGEGASAAETLSRCVSGGYAGALYNLINLPQILNLPSTNSSTPLAVSAALLGGVILMGVLGSVMLAAALLFLVRFLTLLILIVVSPIALVSAAIPALKQKVWHKWWNYLLRESFFAPLFFAGMWITFVLLSGLRESLLGPEGGQFNYADAFAGQLNFVSVLLLYGAAVGLVYATLHMARSVSASTSDGFLRHVHGYLEKHKWQAVTALSLGAGAWAPLAAYGAKRIAEGAARGGKVAARTGTAIGAALLRKRYGDHILQLKKRAAALAARSTKQVMEEESLGKKLAATARSVVVIPAAQQAQNLAEALYTGRGELANNPLVKFVAHAGGLLKQSQSEFDRDAENHLVAALTRKFELPEEVKNQRKVFEDEVDQEALATNTIRDKRKETAKEIGDLRTRQQLLLKEGKDLSPEEAQRLAQLEQERAALDEELNIAKKAVAALQELPQAVRLSLKKGFDDLSKNTNLLNTAITKWQKNLKLSDREERALQQFSLFSATTALSHAALADPAKFEEADRKALEAVRERLSEKGVEALQDMRIRRTINNLYSKYRAREETKPLIDRHLTAADREWAARAKLHLFDHDVVEPLKHDHYADMLRLVREARKKGLRVGFMTDDALKKALDRAEQNLLRLAAGQKLPEEAMRETLNTLSKIIEAGQTETTLTGAEVGLPLGQQNQPNK